MVATHIPDPSELEDEIPEEQPKNSSRLIQWLVVGSLALLFVPLFLISSTIKDGNVPLQTQAAGLELTLTATIGPNPTESALNGTFIGIQKQLNALSAAQPTLQVNRLDWPTVMFIVGTYNQKKVVLVGIAQSNRIITVTGQAVDENAIMEYAQALKDSSQFTRVVVQGITIKPSQTALPTMTPTSTPSQTFTPSPGTPPAQTATPVRTQTPTVTAVTTFDDLRDKYASFTIVLETKKVVTATATPS